MTSEPVLRLSGISKRFGPLLANDGISLTLHAGEVLALLGENGAGKSTLVSILFGHYVADAGHIEVLGQPLPAGQPRAALAAGIGMVHQHFTLADNLSVLDNVMIGTEPLWRPASRRAQARQRLLAVAQRFGLAVLPDARVGSLSVGERQRVEILKALYRGARILILDEPTAVLTPAESEALFHTLGQMVAQGLSILSISHKLDEVLRVSHRVAVLRQGRLVAEATAAGTTAGQLAQWMVGHAVAEPVRRPAAAVGAPVCALRAVSTPSGVRDRLDAVSLTLHAGEIVAVAGVSGNGQVALAELLCGMRPASAGEVLLHGQALRASPAWLVAQGVARIPEDRHAVGVVGDLPVWENAVAERLSSPAFSRGPWVRLRAAQRHAQRVVQTFDVRGGGLHSPARSLSGGNMQKLILGRSLTPTGAASSDHSEPRAAGNVGATAPPPGRPKAGPAPGPGEDRGLSRSWGSEPRAAGSVGAAALPPGRPKAGPAPGPGEDRGLSRSWGSEPRAAGSVGAHIRFIVAHQPTWGLDIGAVSFVHQQLVAARDAGAAVLVISDDLDEVLTLGDRIAVMHHGRLTEALPAEAWSRERIGLAMAGAAPAGASHAA